jgi:hypothetical protein
MKHELVNTGYLIWFEWNIASSKMTSIIWTITWVLKCCTMKTKLLLMLALLASMWFLAGMPYFFHVIPSRYAIFHDLQLLLSSVSNILFSYCLHLISHFRRHMNYGVIYIAISVTPFCWFVTASSMNMVPGMTIIPQRKLAMLTLRLHLVVTLLKRWLLMHMLYSLMTLLLRYSSFHKILSLRFLFSQFWLILNWPVSVQWYHMGISMGCIPSFQW